MRHTLTMLALIPALTLTAFSAQAQLADIPNGALEKTITVIDSDDAFARIPESNADGSPANSGDELADLFASGEFAQLRQSLLGGLLDRLDLGLGLGDGNNGGDLLGLNALGGNGLLNGLPLDLGGVLNDASVQLGELTQLLNLNNTLGGILRGL